MWGRGNIQSWDQSPAHGDNSLPSAALAWESRNKHILPSQIHCCFFRTRGRTSFFLLQERKKNLRIISLYLNLNSSKLFWFLIFSHKLLGPYPSLMCTGFIMHTSSTNSNQFNQTLEKLEVQCHPVGSWYLKFTLLALKHKDWDFQFTLLQNTISLWAPCCPCNQAVKTLLKFFKTFLGVHLRLC